MTCWLPDCSEEKILGKKLKINEMMVIINIPIELSIKEVGINVEIDASIGIFDVL